MAMGTIGMALASVWLASAVPPAVQTAIEAAAKVDGARVEVTRLATQGTHGCAIARAEVALPIEGSGRVTLRMAGQGRDGRACSGWGTATVKVLAPAPVALRPVRTGESLDGAIDWAEREVLPGRAPVLVPAGAVATRPLTPGQLVDASSFRVRGPAVGEPIKVRVVLGAIAVEQVGRVTSCGLGKACASLPSGKHVEGRFVDGKLVVEVP
jgi:hypothetical protein